ncbi:hypothetical protein EMIT0196MI5_360024 [Pseudomonas sp. IT-196MI5]
MAVLISVAIAFPLGVLAARAKRVAASDSVQSPRKLD